MNRYFFLFLIFLGSPSFGLGVDSLHTKPFTAKNDKAHQHKEIMESLAEIKKSLEEIKKNTAAPEKKSQPESSEDQEM